MTHSFDVEIAENIGLPEAIIMQHLEFWHVKNCANKQNFHDGYYWTYNTIAGFQAIFKYLSEKVIRRILDDFEKKAWIVTGNYNETKYDRTKWYALTETGYSICTKGQMDLSKTANQFVQKGEPIPYSKTYNKTDNKNICEISKNFTTDFSIVDEVSNVENLKRKKVAQKKEKGEPKENSMKIYATLYDSLYIEIFSGVPYIFTAKDFKALKGVLDVLKTAYKKKYNLEPSEQELKYSFEFFIREAAKDNWLRNNFTLSIINGQSQNIIHKIKNNYQNKENGINSKSQSDLDQIARVISSEW